MVTIQISIPDHMKSWVESHSENGDASVFLQDLIMKAQERERSIAQLNHLIDEAHASGKSTDSEEDIWQQALIEYRQEAVD